MQKSMTINDVLSFAPPGCFLCAHFQCDRCANSSELFLILSSSRIRASLVFAVGPYTTRWE